MVSLRSRYSPNDVLRILVLKFLDVGSGENAYHFYNIRAMFKG
jgi:hypothetical protein